MAGLESNASHLSVPDEHTQVRQETRAWYLVTALHYERIWLKGPCNEEKVSSGVAGGKACLSVEFSLGPRHVDCLARCITWDDNAGFTTASLDVLPSQECTSTMRGDPHDPQGPEQMEVQGLVQKLQNFRKVRGGSRIGSCPGARVTA